MRGAWIAQIVGQTEPSTRSTLTDRFRRFAATSLALAFIAGCDRVPGVPKRSTGAKSNSTTNAKVDAPANSSIDLSLGTAYSATALSSVGSVAGSLRIIDSASFDDSAAAHVVECSPKGRRPTPLPPAKQFGNTVVWIANAKSGKAMPIDKRAELSSDNCLLDPRVQAVVVGTTVSVINDDKVLHKLVFTKFGTHDTLTATPFFNSGQIVATERLAKTPGIVEVTCVQHPWERGFIAVFDQPYFAVTEDNGSFRIDSLPPGSYKVMVWHEGLAKPTEQQVQVAAGGTATLAR